MADLTVGWRFAPCRSPWSPKFQLIFDEWLYYRCETDVYTACCICMYVMISN